jgi:hypothetical protein
LHPKCTKKTLDNSVSSNETWVYYFEPKTVLTESGHQKMSNVLVLPKECKPCRIFNVIFFDNKGPVMQISVPKGKIITGNFYKNVVIKKMKK